MSNFSVVDSQTQTQFCITRDENISPKSILGYMDLGTPSQIKHSSTLQVMLEKLENENQKLCQELEEAIVRTELQQRLLQEQQKNLEERDKLLETITDMEKKYAKLKKKIYRPGTPCQGHAREVGGTGQGFGKKKFHYQINDEV